MKVLVQAQRLASALRALPAGVLLHDTISLHATHDRFVAVYRGGDSDVQVSLPAQVSQAGSISTHISLLHRLAPALGTDAEVALRATDRRLQIDGERKRVSVPLLEVPPLDPIPTPTGGAASVPMPVLQELIRTTLPVLLKEQSAIATRRTCFVTADAHGLVFSGSDAHRLVTVEHVQSYPTLPVLAIDRVRLQLLLAALKPVERAAQANLYLPDGDRLQLQASTEEGIELVVSFPARLDESMRSFYDSLNRYRESETEIYAGEIDAELLKRAASRSALVHASSGRPSYLLIHTAPQELMLATVSETGAYYIERLASESQPGLSLVVNPKYFRQTILGTRIELGVSQRALVVVAHHDEYQLRARSVVMPYVESVREMVYRCLEEAASPSQTE